MSLENLLGISLDRIEPSQTTIAQLLAAAERNLADSQRATALLAHVKAWLTANKPELL